MKTNEEKQKSKGLTSNDLRPSQWCRLVTTAMESGYAIDGELWRRGEAGRGGARRGVRTVCVPPWEMVNRGCDQTICFFSISFPTSSYFGPGGGWQYQPWRRGGVC